MQTVSPRPFAVAPSAVVLALFVAAGVGMCWLSAETRPSAVTCTDVSPPQVSGMRTAHCSLEGNETVCVLEDVETRTQLQYRQLSSTCGWLRESPLVGASGG